MANWKYDFTSGAKLHSLIREGDKEETNKQENAAQIVETIVGGLRRFERMDSVAELVTEHEGDASAIRTDPDDFFSPYYSDDLNNPVQAYVNILLAEFWDVCDLERIWVDPFK
jgi:hypothetical protein